MSKIFAAIVFCLASTSANAFYCSQPRDPNCPMLGKFDGEFDFNMCKSQMERYKSDLEDYADCLDREKSEALEDYNKAVKRFNCAASGESFCY